MGQTVAEIQYWPERRLITLHRAVPMCCAHMAIIAYLLSANQKATMPKWYE